MIETRPFGRIFLLVLLGYWGSGPLARAQYPSGPQIHKDGTAVLLEDYATVPFSSPSRHAGVEVGFVPLQDPPKTAINFKGDPPRVTSLRSDPANAPQAASRLFVNDENGTLYILDKKTKEFTPYLRLVDIFANLLANGGPMGVVSFAFDPD